MNKLTLTQAQKLAERLNLELSTTELRKLLSLNQGLPRAQFSSDAYYDFYRMVNGDVPVPANPAQVVEATTPFELAHNITSSDLNERYIISTVGLIPRGPVSLAQATHDFHALKTLHTVTDSMQSTSTWLLGDILCAMRAANGGEPIDMEELMDPADKALNTIKTAASVAAAFPPDQRRPDLTYSHYKELYYAKGLTAPQKAKLLEIAAEHKLNTKETRSIGSTVKRSENPDATIEVLATRPEALATALHKPRSYNYYALGPEPSTIRMLTVEEQPAHLDIRTCSVVEQFIDGEWKPITVRHS